MEVPGLFSRSAENLPPCLLSLQPITPPLPGLSGFPTPLCDHVLRFETFPIPKRIDETPKAVRIAMVASTNNIAKSILGTSWGVGSVKIQSHFLATVIPPSVIKRKGG